MRPTRLALRLCAVVLSLAAASCAISSERDDERATAWTRAYLDARCRFHVRCEAQFGTYAWREQLVCHPDSWATSLFERAARVGTAFTFDEARAQRCLAAIEDARCCVPQLEPYDPDLLDCNAVLMGALPEGSACNPTPPFGGCADYGTCVADAGTCGGVCVGRAERGESCDFRRCVDGTECRSGADGRGICRGVELEPGAECNEAEHCRLVGDRPHLCIDGRCAPQPVLPLGDACEGAIGICSDDAACVDGICVPRVGEGVRCRSLGECQEGLYCDGPAPEGRCAWPAGECAVDADCPAASAYCIYGDDGAGRCSADPTGARCWPYSSGVWTFHATESCPESHRCAPNEVGLLVCRPIVAEGAACDATHPCAEGTRCDAGWCVALVGPGDACGVSALCPLSHRCVDGSCAPLPTLGDACEGVCFEGGCRDGRCELLGEGEPCDAWADGAVRQCRGRCVGGACGGERVGPGASCGLRVGQCDYDLVCVPQIDDSGLCGAPCSG